MQGFPLRCVLLAPNAKCLFLDGARPLPLACGANCLYLCSNEQPYHCVFTCVRNLITACVLCAQVYNLITQDGTAARPEDHGVRCIALPCVCACVRVCFLCVCFGVCIRVCMCACVNCMCYKIKPFTQGKSSLRPKTSVTIKNTAHTHYKHTCTPSGNRGESPHQHRHGEHHGCEVHP